MFQFDLDHSGRPYVSGGRPREKTDPRSRDVKELWDQLDRQMSVGDTVEVGFSDGSKKTIMRIDDKTDLILEGVHANV